MEANTIAPKAVMMPRVRPSGMWMPKASRTGANCISTATSATSQTMDSSSQPCGGACTMPKRMDRKFSAMIISTMMNRKNISVRAVPMSARSCRNRAKNSGISRHTASSTKVFTSQVNTLSRGSRGGRSMMSGSGGATPRASAGRPSVARLMYRMAAGSRGRYSGPSSSTVPPMTATSVMLQRRRKVRDFLMLS